MVGTISRSTRNAFVLSKRSLRKIDELLAPIGARTYDVRRADDFSFQCATVDELLKDGSPPGKTIDAITIFTMSGGDRGATITMRRSSQNANVTYSLRGEEGELHLLADKIEGWLDELTPRYSWIARSGWPLFLATIAGAWGSIWLARRSIGNLKWETSIEQVLLVTFVILALAGPWFRERFFPLGDFAIGFGITASRRAARVRGFVFGTVLLGFVISFLASILANAVR